MTTMWMDVDAALTEVPVNIIALVDAATAKVIDEGVTYDEAGMDLIWHFETTAGVNTATPVTPTTGGDYDWAHTDGGMYTIEMPASGGASANNDTEGFGYFTGNTTANLPWRGPTIGFRDAGLNNLLIDAAFSATRGLTGTALPAVAADGAGGLPVSDAGGLDMDGLATLAALLAYVQLMCRKDDAIETDNAAWLTLINTDEGSGGGTFMNETEALEALRDRGDRAWLTGGGEGATKSYTTTDWTRTVGDDDGGAGSDTATVNATYFSTGEVNATTFLEVTAVFTLDDPTETARSIDVWAFYNGGGAHYMTASALDTVGAVYEPLTGSIGVGTTVTKTTFELSPNHTNSSTGVVTMKFLHGGSATGIISHVFSIDKAQVNSSVPSTTAAKLLAYVQLLARSDSAIETDNVTELGEINTNEGSGVGNYSSQTDAQEAIRDWVGDGANLVEAGGDGDHLTAINLPNQTMDITGNLSGSVGSVGTGGITAASIAAAAIDNATFAADVQSTAYATNIIAQAVGNALINFNLDHLMLTPVANNADMTVEVADGTVFSNLLSSTSDTSTYVVASHSQQGIVDTGVGVISMSAAALADFFEVDSTKTYAADAIAGSVVKEIAANCSALGAGAITDTFTVTVSGSPVANCAVWVTTDQAGANVLVSGFANSSGVITFSIDIATGYWVWASIAGYNATGFDPKEFNVASGGFAWA